MRSVCFIFFLIAWEEELGVFFIQFFLLIFGQLTWNVRLVEIDSEIFWANFNSENDNHFFKTKQMNFRIIFFPLYGAGCIIAHNDSAAMMDKHKISKANKLLKCKPFDSPPSYIYYYTFSWILFMLIPSCQIPSIYVYWSSTRLLRTWSNGVNGVTRVLLSRSTSLFSNRSKWYSFVWKVSRQKTFEWKSQVWSKMRSKFIWFSKYGYICRP